MNTRNFTLDLPDRWAPRLRRQGETGMGYTTASISLVDGSTIEDVLIVGSTIAEVLHQDFIPFAVEDIADIKATHRKWEFRK